MRIDLDVDPNEASRPLTARERFGVYVLLAIFGIVFPMKFSHQLGDLWKALEELKSK